MSITTYAALKSSVQDWINKTSISAAADDFVTLAEAYLNTELRTSQQLVLATGTLSTNPTDLSTELTRFARMRSISISIGGEDGVLNYISQDLRMAQYADKSTGVPVYYTLIGDNLYVDPTMDQAYAYTMMYYQYLAPLATADTNWLLEKYPNIYLYASLVEAAIYAKDQEAAMGYIALRDRYIGMLRKQDIRDRAGGTSRMISEVRAV